MTDNQMQLEDSLHRKLSGKYKGRVTVWRINENNSVIYVDQNKDNPTRGYVVGEISDKISKVTSGMDRFCDVREMTRVEYDSIIEFFQYQAEPHDIDNFKNDVFVVEEEE
jgi:hypothetical protein